MGKGPTDKPSVLADAAAPADDSGAPQTACAEERSIVVELAPGSDVAIGDAVTVSLGRPPAVWAGSVQVGVVDAFDAADIEGCQSFGYRFSGSVTDVDLAAAKAVAVVRGRRDS